MQKFEFKAHTEQVEIANKVYTIDCSTKASDRIGEMSREMMEMIHSADKGNLRESAAQKYREYIDEILGKGTTKEILPDADFDDAVDVLMFIFGVIQRHNRARFAGKNPGSKKKNRR